MAYKVMFSEARQALIREIRNSAPQLRLDLGQAGTWPEAVGTIAAHCNIAMDGLYTEEDMERLYVILVHKLKEMNTIRIIN